MKPVHTPYLKAVSLAVAVALGFGPSMGRAQAIVNDPIHQIQNILTQLQGMAKDGAEYATQAQRWYATYAHYQQQLVTMTGIMKSFQLPAGKKLETVGPDHLVTQRCGSGAGLRGMLQSIAPNRDDDYIAQQRAICASMQRIQNTKYNETVMFLRDTVPRMEADVKRVQSMRASDNNQGTVDAAAEASAHLMTELATQMGAWNVRMQAYDGIVDSLQESQRQLAKMALQGERNEIGTLVRTGALKSALKIGN